MGLVYGNTKCFSPCAGKIFRGKGRFSHQTRQGLWGLYPQLRNLSTHTSKALALGSTNSGLLCHPQQHQVSPFHFSSASLGGLESEQFTLPTSGTVPLLCQPSWTVILPWLNRLWQNPHLTCLTVVPYWVSAIWWPLLVKLHVPNSPAILVPPLGGLFQDCWGCPCHPQGGPSSALYYQGGPSEKESFR